ncbi:HAD-like domain-containing protein [Pilobolus umbonatus]|nr:HAD-like domain-containing protein [Pilobolus umbonatus]
MKVVDSLSEILSKQKYDTIACDIYGVLHDGIQTYPYSQSALHLSQESHQRILLLSNSTRLQDKLEKSLQNTFEIDNTCYEEIISSGKLTKLFLADMAEYLSEGKMKYPPACHATALVKGKGSRMEPDEFSRKYLKTGKFFLAGDPDWQEPLYMPLSPIISRVYDWNEMDFVLLGSIRGLSPEKDIDVFSEKEVREDYQPLLDKCLERGIPIICANPDVFAPNGLNEDGTTKFLICPGYVGQMYEDMGGMVLYFGKPFKSIYEYLMTHKSQSTNRHADRILCVGDNIATDIKGATDAGLDVVLILGGVHYEEFKAIQDEDTLKMKVKELCDECNSKEPTYIMPLLKY